VEAGVRQGWDRYIGSQGVFVGMTSFGASAPHQQLYKHFGITMDRVLEETRMLLDR
jgi:transketolase